MHKKELGVGSGIGAFIAVIISILCALTDGPIP